MSWLNILNFAILQWFGLRVWGVWEVDLDPSTPVMTLTYRRRTGWWVDRWIWPLTGWWGPVRYVRYIRRRR